MHAKISSLELRFTRKKEWLWLITTGMQTAQIIDNAQNHHSYTVHTYVHTQCIY